MRLFVCTLKMSWEELLVELTINLWLSPNFSASDEPKLAPSATRELVLASLGGEIQSADYRPWQWQRARTTNSHYGVFGRPT